MRLPQLITNRGFGVVAEAAKPTATTPSLRARLLPFGLWTFVSLQVGTFFSQGDEGAQLLLHFDHVAALLLGQDVAVPTLPGHISHNSLADHLELIARAASLNDSLKLRLLHAPGVVDRLLQLVQPDTTSESRLAAQHAAKVLEAISASANAQRGETPLRRATSMRARLSSSPAHLSVSCVRSVGGVRRAHGAAEADGEPI